MRVKKNIILMGMGMLFLLFISVCSSSNGLLNKEKKESENVGVEKKDLAYEFDLLDIKGKNYQLSDYKGKPVVVKFWASWCPICLSGLDEVDKISEDRDKNYELITIVSPGYKNEKNSKDFINWFNTLEINHTTVLLDDGGKLSKKMAIRAMPTYVYYDSFGEIQKTVPGHADSETIKNNVNEIERMEE